jgi:cysteine desulfurase
MTHHDPIPEIHSYYLLKIAIVSKKMPRKLPPLLLLAGGVSCYYYYIKLKKRQEADESESCIYLDYNGTTPVYPDVIESMMPYFTEHYGNPSSGHKFGKAPRQAIDHGRKQILALLGSEEPISSIWFAGCGTESDNLAIQLAMQSTSFEPKHIVTTNVEHPAVELYLKHLEKERLVTVTYVPVDTEGRVSSKDVLAALTPNTILVTLMLANNESGALQPVKEVAMECRKRGILMHTDAAQAAGKVSCQIQDLGCPDLISVVGHKLGA